MTGSINTEDTPEKDLEGFLLRPEHWTPATAANIADAEGIELTSAHWEILTLIREFYHSYHLSPAMRPLCRYIKLHLGNEKSSSIYLLSLFPGSPAKLAAKIAGLPKPPNCL